MKSRLKDDGLLQTWFPGGEKLTLAATARAIADEFPHVRIYCSIENWGSHFTASMQPFAKPTVEEFVARIPERARTDLLEWSNGRTLEEYIRSILEREVPLDEVLNPDADVCVTHDHPYNEYFFLRRLWDKLTGRHRLAH